MKQILFTCLVSILCSLFFTGCAQGTDPASPPKSAAETSAWQTAQGRQRLAEQIVQNMTQEEKVGQLLIIGLSDTVLQATDQELLRSCHAGGVILFDRNMKNKQQVADLIRELQKMTSPSLQLPLFVAVDQEGGRVTRMRQAMIAAPSAASIAAGKNPKVAYEYAYKIGRELKDLGFNLNFAPVLDISANMDGRTYGSTPEQVELFGKEAARGFADSGILFTLKHFPGMGRSLTDPHNAASVVTINKEELLQNELRPFRSVIAQTSPDKMLIMAGHVKYPEIGSEPASLSSVMITQILRKELGYKGLVCTDDLDMGAISKNYSPETAGIRALQAGAEILLSCHTPTVQRRIYQSILEALKNGSLDSAIIDKAAAKVTYVKLQQLMTDEEVKNIYLRLHRKN